jgi:branched-chain amino acid transport system permease protein
MINFALGEWVMLGSRLVATGVHALGLGLGGGIVLGAAGMMALAVAFNRFVLRPMVGQPLFSFIMVTIGLGALMRGGAAVALRGVPAGIPLPISQEPWDVMGIAVAGDKLAAAAVAAACIAGVNWFFGATRTGVALRALADDPGAAMAVGIDANHHFAVAWALAGALAVLAGTLWTSISGAGFSVVLVGLKVFPIVIIGGLDSIGGTIVGAIAVGLLESLAAGYVDPQLGGGFSTIASYLVLLAVLFVRPRGLFGRPAVERV